MEGSSRGTAVLERCPAYARMSSFRRWDSLSVIDRRTRQAKTHAVLTLEQAVLNVAMSRTSENVSLQKSDGGGQKQGDEDKRQGDARSGGRSSVNKPTDK